MTNIVPAGDQAPQPQQQRVRPATPAARTRPVGGTATRQPLGPKQQRQQRQRKQQKEQAAEVPGPAVRVRAGSPTAVLAIVPHLLGFVPESSIVVIGTEASKGAVKVTLRYDLPDRDLAADTAEDIAEDIAEDAAAILVSQRLAAAIVVGYGPDDLVRPVAMAFGKVMRRNGIDLPECLRAENERYWSYTCDDMCCPAEGVPFDAATHAASSALAEAGERVLADRGAVAARIAPITGAKEEAMRRATRRAERYVTQVLAKVRKSVRIGAARHMIASEGLAAVAGMIDTYRAGGQFSTEDQVAWLTVALKDMRIRDDAWARMDPGDRDAHLRLWTDVVRRAQPGYVAAPASLLAFVAWQDGNGVLANVALDRALADLPGYSMATLLRQVITAGAPPSMARLPMTPDEVAACYEGLDDLDDVLCEDDEDSTCGDGAVPGKGAR